jgi:hypothetical protein
LIYEYDAEVPPGSTMTYKSSSRARLPRPRIGSPPTAELPTGEITAIAVIENEEPNCHATVTAGLTA